MEVLHPHNFMASLSPSYQTLSGAIPFQYSSPPSLRRGVKRSREDEMMEDVEDDLINVSQPHKKFHSDLPTIHPPAASRFTSLHTPPRDDNRSKESKEEDVMTEANDSSEMIVYKQPRAVLLESIERNQAKMLKNLLFKPYNDRVVIEEVFDDDDDKTNQKALISTKRGTVIEAEEEEEEKVKEGLSDAESASAQSQYNQQPIGKSPRVEEIEDSGELLEPEEEEIIGGIESMDMD